MTGASKLIKNSSNANASKLIKAMKGWNTGNFFENKPNGVFGSQAIIKCNGATIKSNELDIEFQVPF